MSDQRIKSQKEISSKFSLSIESWENSSGINLWARNKKKRELLAFTCKVKIIQPRIERSYTNASPAKATVNHTEVFDLLDLTSEVIDIKLKEKQNLTIINGKIKEVKVFGQISIDSISQIEKVKINLGGEYWSSHAQIQKRISPQAIGVMKGQNPEEFLFSIFITQLNKFIIDKFG